MEYHALIKSLRQLLKTRGVRYQDVAAHLGVSEQTVKRLLSADDGSVGRLAEVCAFLGVTFFDLTRMAGEEREETFTLSGEQEEHFCAEPLDYGIFDALLRGQTPAKLAERYGLKPSVLDGALKRLERLELVARLPGARVRLLRRGQHNWLASGPLQRRFIVEENVAFVADLAGQLGPEAAKEHFFTGSERRVTQETLRAMRGELEETFSRFRRRAQTDEALQPAERLVAVKWLACLALRPGWFERYLLAEQAPPGSP